MPTARAKLSAEIPSRSLVVASTRFLLGAIAQWTAAIFDDGAAKRLAGRGTSVWGQPIIFDPQDLASVRTNVAQVEGSKVLHAIVKAYDFGRSGFWPGTQDQLDAIYKGLMPFWTLIERNGLCDEMETDLLDPDAARAVLYVCRLFEVRFRLLRGEPISLPQLALLSGLTEKTIRMGAIRGKRARQDIVTYKAGSRTWVRATEANRWLAGRENFKPTRLGGDAELVMAPKTQLELASLLTVLREKLELTREEIAERIGLQPRDVSHYEALEDGWWNDSFDLGLFDQKRLLRLANELRIKKPVPFVRAIEELLSPFRLESASAMSPQRKS